MFAPNVSLAQRTTLGVGGSARYVAEPDSAEAVIACLEAARAQDLPVFVLGGGSNLVISDNGWPGLVLAPRLCYQRGQTVGAGVAWDTFVDSCVAQDLAGVECLAGIPGTVGATPIQNVGAYGQEVADTLVSVTVLDRQSLAIQTFSRDDCHFAYRQSRFNTTDMGRWLILEVTFALTPGGRPSLAYRDVRQFFGEGATPSLTDVAAAVRQIRAKKGMVVDPTDPDSRSAGSFFKNPILTGTVPEGAPTFPQPDGSMKVPAAWLIERSGLQRGQTLAGGIGISQKHVLALVNQGGGTADDVVQAAQHVQAAVEARWGITLHPEPIFVGFAPEATLPVGATRIDGG